MVVLAWYADVWRLDLHPKHDFAGTSLWDFCGSFMLIQSSVSSVSSEDRDSINQAIDEFSSSCIEDATELIVVYFAGYAVATDRGRVQLQLQKAAHAEAW